MLGNRPSQADLAKSLQPLPEVGSWWRHYRGMLVRVVGRAVDEVTLAPLVLYSEWGGERGLVFARTFSAWNEIVQALGMEVPRFVPTTPPKEDT